MALSSLNGKELRVMVVNKFFQNTEVTNPSWIGHRLFVEAETHRSAGFGELTFDNPRTPTGVCFFVRGCKLT